MRDYVYPTLQLSDRGIKDAVIGYLQSANERGKPPYFVATNLNGRDLIKNIFASKGIRAEILPRKQIPAP